MKLVLYLGIALAVSCLVVSGQEQQRILRRVIKSTPTASNLGRVRLVTVRSAGTGVEKGTVQEISSKEAAAFGQRSANETSAPSSTSQQQVGTKTKSVPAAAAAAPTTSTTSTVATPITSSAAPVTTTTEATSTASSSSSTTLAPSTSTESERPKASERQQVAPQSQGEVELLSSAPSSWQMMTAVEAPASALIAAGTRAAQSSSDLSSASSEDSSSYGSQSNDFLRASGKTSYSSSTGETFSRLRQQQTGASKTRQQQQQQQSFFYPQQQQQQQRAQSKTSNYQATKTHWYQPTTSTTTPRPAPIIQQQEQYEQQSEQYVEQQQVEGAAPLGQAEPFAFDFNTRDDSGNGQYRKEESDNNGVVRGSYGFRDASGMYRHVEYVADANGFRANIKSNEPGLLAPEGDSQPASIKLTASAGPSQQNQRYTNSNSNNNNDNGEWQAASSSSNERADLALAPPDFESSHKAERVRVARHFRQ